MGTEEQTEFNWIARSGKATVTYANGCTYEGEFNSEKQKHGLGTYTWVEPDEEEGFKKVATYEGNYADGKRNGIGKMTFPSGDVYHGEWKDNKIEGQGTYTYAKTKDVYSGPWENGKKHGTGCYEFGKDRSKLNGIWENGEYASGEWIFDGAGKYTGTFKGGKPIGEGSFEFPSGIKLDGEYVVPKTEGEEDGEEDSNVTPSWVGKPVYSTAK